MSKLILLIDDDWDEMAIFSMAVSMAGWQCDYLYANSVNDAMQRLERETPAYIFVDMNMPKTNGLTCVANIRKLHKFDSVPVIVYSTGVDAGLVKQAIAAGANGCVKKEGSLTVQSEKIGRALMHLA